MSSCVGEIEAFSSERSKSRVISAFIVLWRY
jgi:hypothetical protein